MKTATFKNFSDEVFEGCYNGRCKKFPPGVEVDMPAYLARHFAKHLANRELIKVGKVTATSPKKPQEVPEFMDMFNKGFQLVEHQEEDFGAAEDPNSIDAVINSARRNKARVNASNVKLPSGAQHLEGKPDQIVEGPASDDDEEEFGGSPKES